MVAVDSLDAVKTIQSFNSSQKEKTSLQNQFKRIATRIKVLNNKLIKDYIPEIRDTAKLEKKIEKKQEKIAEAKPTPEPKVKPQRAIPKSKYDSEIDELKDLINSI